MGGACQAPVSHLLLFSPQRNSIKNPKNFSKIPLPLNSRRFFLFSLPLLLPISIKPTSCSDSFAASYDPLTLAEKNDSAALSKRVSEALMLLEKGRELQAVGDFKNALDYFTLVVENYKDFAFSEYARVGRALALYEVGDREEAIAEMEDVSVSLKGYPEVHAALAAALYVDKHAPLLAENQFAIATLLDPHYTDLSYVKETKHWPPSLVSSLQHFITLS
ncbi:Tetratricopeptide-like helical [Melia azedarach]|uniref:Tetratricopeptide-like helical n=1 Tax=Melia azedarach TaxID=155640 RepID=A0ACC1XV69_MELAZ|nr:Tetratricopeptide-like helical [Melia azedarach]